MFTTYRNTTRYDVRRDLVPPPNSYCIVNLLVLRTTWWWPTYKAETCSCILRSVAYYIVILSDKLLCFWLHVYVNIHIIIHCLSLSLQGPAAGACPESDQCSAHRHTRFFDIHFTVIFLSTAGSLRVVSSLHHLRLKLCLHFSSLLYVIVYVPPTSAWR